MAAAKVAVSIDARLLRELDTWVARGEFPNRSRAVQAAIESLRRTRMRRRRFLRELAKLDPSEMKRLAEERFEAEAPWPEY